MKTCSRCKIEKPIDKFVQTRRRSGSMRPSSWCKQCRAEDKKQRSLTPEGKRRLKDEALRRFFGINVQDFEIMHTKQNGLCAICRKPQPPRNRHGRILEITLAVDHCHATGRIRGLLCDKCNFGIAHFQEDVEILKNAIAYLELHS